MELQAKHSEISFNLKGIQTAELLPCPSGICNRHAYPSTPTAGQNWQVPYSGGFAYLGWQSDGKVRGSIDVSTTTTGLTDVDGTLAIYIATDKLDPKQTTDLDVY